MEQRKPHRKQQNRECKRKGRIYQNRTVRKDEFFEALPWLKSKIASIIKVLYTYKDHTQIVSEFLDFLPNLGE